MQMWTSAEVVLVMLMQLALTLMEATYAFATVDLQEMDSCVLVSVFIPMHYKYMQGIEASYKFHV